jgi:3-hydroxyisobutyrate dehydrogenase-like beta-hydroxyacid dehydrogenase
MMGDVSFIGLGDMGCALASTTAKAGYDTIVWNRTKKRATPLLEQGARLASSPAEAISESPIVVVCVSDYEVADAMLQTTDCLAAMKGHVPVQLSSGSPKLASTTNEWVQQAGASYLDGEIVAYPSQIGGLEAQIFIAGDETAFAEAEPLLRVLSPLTEYLGDTPARASALNLAIISAGVGLITGVISGAAICEAAGVSLVEFGRHFPLSTASDAKALVESLRKIEDGGLDESDASIDGWAPIVDSIVEYAKETGYDPEVSAFIKRFFGQAIDRGLGAHDVGALINVLRPDRKQR